MTFKSIFPPISIKNKITGEFVEKFEKRMIINDCSLLFGY
ncbi:hypothetical protein CHCC15290_0972 [Bacillus licheniformis]|nr:hypothetical protein B4090_2795 [Bacillus licheniformis]OLF94121.1 hypothetical protein B4089_1364 [Bacillus licheniformis]TWK70273.1 hypothetical protein CHCC20342_3522 [Bacillus licheniformis]TWL59641.1 hypothetical protein CHCC15322_2891 [Bacillus licheniformis]TWL93334.1 hypothetical protein CHCC15290_0972 [Bacillus licheniformis]